MRIQRRTFQPVRAVTNTQRLQLHRRQHLPIFCGLDLSGQPASVVQIAAQALGAETVVTPVSSNSGVMQKGFARVIRTRIGSPFVIAALEAAGGRVVGYEARGPSGGPIVVATVRGKDRNENRVFEAAKALVTLNVGD